MAFTGLSDRFEQKYKEIYSKFPLPQQGQTEPYLTFTPDNPSRLETKHDSRSVFPGTIKRETRRLGRFLDSEKGRIFLIRQSELQTGNTFAETRIVNPLSLTSGIIPFRHFSRPLGKASGIPLENAYGISGGATSNIGSAGRLQKETKEKVVSSTLGYRSPPGLLNILFPNNGFVRTVSAIKNALRKDNVLSINDRPEIDFNGQLYSVAVWRGFRAQSGPQNTLDKASTELRYGRVTDAINTIKSGVRQLVKGKTGLDTLLQRADMDNDNPDPSISGYRYFITSEASADRYLRDSVTVKGHLPVASVGFMNRSISAKSSADEIKEAVTSTKNSIKIEATKVIDKNKKQIQSLAQVTRNLRRAGSFLFGSSIPVNKFVDIVPPAITKDIYKQDVAESRMLYSDLSLQTRYAAQLESMNLDVQRDGTWQQKQSALTPKFIGIRGGLTVGDSDTTRARNGVFKDPMNAYGPVLTNVGSNDANITNDNIKNIRDNTGNLIDFIFYDYVNKKILPFRAFIADINESVSPNFIEQPYIGRPERNIVYTGTVRDVSFRFRVQAFSEDELSNVWGKINYLTGMTHPSKYVDGFMVPPLVKLTIGNIYKDQPGYIKSLSFEWETDDWEVTPSQQAPKGVNVNVAFSIIEKKQMAIGSEFYPIKGAWDSIKPVKETSEITPQILAPIYSR